MATSGTYAFTLDLAEIIEEAYERIGSELRTGYNYRTARRSLDLLMLEWQNKGLNLWTIKEANLPLLTGIGSYTLTGEKLDIIEGVLRTDNGIDNSQSDLFMKRVSISNWARQTSKLQRGRPTQYWVERSPEAITLHFWQVPSNDDYSFNYWYMEQVEDTGKPGSNNMSVPARHLPSLTAGLAYYLALKTPGKEGMATGLLAEYERQWDLAADSVREKASFQIKPGGYRF